MDWIAKFQEEDHRKSEAEKRAKDESERRNRDEATRFEVARQKLGPLLAEQTAQIERRLGIRLNMTMGAQGIKVSAPRPIRSILSAGYPHWFELSDFDGTSVRLHVVDDQRINRSGEPPDDMTYGEYYGTEVTLANVRADIDDLISGDADQLMAWLVACCREEDGSRYLELRCVRKSRQQDKDAERTKATISFSAGLFLFLGIASLFFRPLGIVALIGGIYVRSRLMHLGQTQGRKAAAWAIGLGALMTLPLLVSITTAVYRNLATGGETVETGRANVAANYNSLITGKWTGRVNGRFAELTADFSQGKFKGELIYDTNGSTRVAEALTFARNGNDVVLVGTGYRFLKGGGGFSLDTLEGKLSENGSRFEGILHDSSGTRFPFVLTRTVATRGAPKQEQY